MIYMVDHVYTDPATEPAWHEWYEGYLRKLLSVPGIYTAQRFKAVACTPSRYLAMYSLESEAVYTSEGYKNIGGGGSQSARFHPAYQLWTRNLFEGAARAPAVRNDQRVLVFDREDAALSASEAENPFFAQAVWLTAVGLHMTTKHRAIVVLDADQVASAPAVAGSYLYAPFTAALNAP